MNVRRIGLCSVFLLGCAVIVNSQSAPVDDDDFEFEGSGQSPRRQETTTATTPVVTAKTLPEASGSGLHSDDEDDADTAAAEGADEWFTDAYDDDLYDDSYDDGAEYDGIGDSDDWPVKPQKPVYVHPPPPPSSSLPPTVATEAPLERTGFGGGLGAALPPRQEKPKSSDVDEDDRARDISIESEAEEEDQTGTEEGSRPNGVDGLGTKPINPDMNFFEHPGVLAAVVGGAVVGLLCAILLVMLIVYRMRKKDEGSYPVDEPKRSLTGNTYSKNYNKEFYA